MASSTSTSSDERPTGVARDPSSGPGPQTHAEWAASMQAYYAAAQQHMVAAAAAAAGAGAPYGAPMPFPMYHPAYYAHPSMAAMNAQLFSLIYSFLGVKSSSSVQLMIACWPGSVQGVRYPPGEAAPVVEGSSKMKSNAAPSGDCSSRSVRSSDCGSEKSSDKRDAPAELKVLPSAKRRKPSNANVKGETSQACTTQDAAAGSPFAAKGRSESRLSAPTPERTTLSNAATNLTIGMNIWAHSPAKAETSEQGEANAGAPSQHAGSLSQMQDERELKRERRKQSNRESARRSRLRKQQECEELAQKVTDLTAVNGALRSELDQLKKACEDMEAENSQLLGEMEQNEGPGGVLTTLSIQIDASKAHPGNNGHLHKNNDDSKG